MKMPSSYSSQRSAEDEAEVKSLRLKAISLWSFSLNSLAVEDSWPLRKKEVATTMASCFSTVKNNFMIQLDPKDGTGGESIWRTKTNSKIQVLALRMSTSTFTLWSLLLAAWLVQIPMVVNLYQPNKGWYFK